MGICGDPLRVRLVRESAMVPVTMGSPQFLSIDTTHFVVTDAFFPPGVALEPHTHDRPILATMVDGGFRTMIAGRALDCSAGVAWTEPLGEQHSNIAGPAGAHVVVIQPDARDEQFLAPFGSMLGAVHRLSDPRVSAQAPRILHELHATDNLSALCVESLVMLLLAAAARRTFRDSSTGRPPGWLLQVRDRVHDEWRAALSLSVLARSAGVHPCYLAHSFKAHFGESIGSFARTLRIQWAMREVALSRRPISEIALGAGFSDQAHFTRECRRHTGLTPAQYRRCTGLGRAEA
jgi:AraC family transcriptional regulator